MTQTDKSENNELVTFSLKNIYSENALKPNRQTEILEVLMTSCTCIELISLLYFIPQVIYIIIY